jgi:hypothetical protein
MLRTTGIPSDIVHIYVAPEEIDEYRDVLDPTYGTLHEGSKGLVEQREHIESDWAGRNVVFMDDDIADVDISLSGHPTLEALISEAFEECERQGAYIWGVYPVLNHYFTRSVKNAVTTNLSYIVGAFYGIRRRREDLRLTLTRDGQKEDVERSVKYFLRDGTVLRYNLVGVKTKYYRSGGLGKLKDRIGPMTEAVRRLEETYPELGYATTRPSGAVEFKLRRIPAREGRRNATPRSGLFRT